MNRASDIKYLRGLVDELRKLPTETSWVEFKHNKQRNGLSNYQGTIEAGAVRPYDPDQAKRNARYLPFWA